MKILSARYDREDKKTFTAMIETDDGEEFPYGVIVGGNDQTEISRMLYAKYNSGELVPDDYVAHVPTDEELAIQIREDRNRLLSETDYLMQPDYPISDGDRDAVRAYRQALRDITAQPGFPREVVWPETPACLKDQVNE